MKNYSLLIVLAGFLLCADGFSLFAQQSDTILLKSIHVESSRTALFLTGKNRITIDTALLQQGAGMNLADALSMWSPLFIKSYGAGSSATLSARGTEARHSSVLWNGFNLNAPGLGLTDLSLIPTTVSDNITIVTGGSSPVNGNASIGSAIYLSRKEPSFMPHSSLRASAETGSFGNRHFSLQSIQQNRYSLHQSSLFYDNAENNFTYNNLAKRDHPKETLQHAGYQNFGLIHYSDFKIKKLFLVSTSIWYQSTAREIPAMMTVPLSEAEQRDSVLRLHAGIKFPLKNSSVRLNIGYFREHQRYDDPQYKIHKNYFLQNFFADAGYRFFIHPKAVIDAGATYNSATAAFEEYQSAKHRNLMSAFMALRYDPFSGWVFNLSLRSEFSNVADPPLCPSLGVEGNLYRNMITLLLNAGRHYNIPSMNDLYWQPGGNSELLPEDALSAEGGFVFFRAKKYIPELSVTVFHSTVDNWIRWLPVAGGIYSPGNVSKVRSEGIESSLKYRLQLSKWTFRTEAHYTWCHAYVIASTEPEAASITGKQLMYSPEHVASLSFTAQYRRIALHFTYHYTGERFTASDNSSSVDAYHLFDLFLNYDIPLKKHSITICTKISNLFNSEYQVMAWRPTPGRWYSGGIKINLNTLKK